MSVLRTKFDPDRDFYRARLAVPAFWEPKRSRLPFVFLGLLACVVVAILLGVSR